jgi:hypothetical protein
MKRKVLVLSFIFAVVVYGVLFTYVFVISPALKENSISSWLAEETEKKPKYRESEVCSECHFEVYTSLLGGNHSTLECEVCHGSGYGHTKYRTSESIVIDDSRDSCLVCHKEIPGRKAVTTIGEDHHVGVKCIVCHEPHG